MMRLKASVQSEPVAEAIIPQGIGPNSVNIATKKSENEIAVRVERVSFAIIMIATTPENIDRVCKRLSEKLKKRAIGIKNDSKVDKSCAITSSLFPTGSGAFFDVYIKFCLLFTLNLKLNHNYPILIVYHKYYDL